MTMPKECKGCEHIRTACSVLVLILQCVILIHLLGVI
jgi:hypothetical protein